MEAERPAGGVPPTNPPRSSEAPVEGSAAPGPVRYARSQDVRPMFALINERDKGDFFLSRSYAYLYDHIRDFQVCERDGEIVGCTGLHIYWSDLGEIYATAAAPGPDQVEVKRTLVQAALDEARRIGLGQVYTLSTNPEFFEEFGFRRSRREDLPQILWQVCVECPLFYDCVESVLVIETAPEGGTVATGAGGLAT
ncbi:MAG TPA: GNAT family N-acetyltransferase [Dehalococcoidia bacterium]|nr:GNAT family N-acetyltransferase [Dehalococcoidia bacterium]